VVKLGQTHIISNPSVWWVYSESEKGDLGANFTTILAHMVILHDFAGFKDVKSLRCHQTCRAGKFPH